VPADFIGLARQFRNAAKAKDEQVDRILAGITMRRQSMPSHRKLA
jgi:hypothetical protein